jgi:murein DD-endopeptidase MepM/ murein hydrolase activator NlpD
VRRRDLIAQSMAWALACAVLLAACGVTGDGAGFSARGTGPTATGPTSTAPSPSASEASGEPTTREPSTRPAIHPSPRPTHVFPIAPSSAASFSEGHHGYPATDIFAPPGSRFVAVTSGVIDEVSRVDRWDRSVNDPATRGGLFVSLIGDDGVRYYGSHLASVARGIEAGIRVVAGQLLGTVGSTGNASGPHLHFGVSHPTHPGDWAVRRGEVDPYPYLTAWLQGRNLTPALP